jgi:asparagine synthase (glutamine-hydrolysing)
MPGIVGFISKQNVGGGKHHLQTMLKTVNHETFYRSGTWIDESLGAYVGWTVIGGSFADGMPLCNERKDVCIVFSGEEYADPGDVQQLRPAGHTIGRQESAYLLHRYEEGRTFLPSLNGMFHGLIADKARGTVTLFNDRFGMHRLYFYQSDQTFYFATEAKAILSVCPEIREVDPRALGEFAALSCVLEDRTLFKDIHLLPAASAWTFRNGNLVQKEKYFDPQEWEQQSTLGADAYFEELRSTLSATLPRYFAGDQKMGIALTGGLDTRVILASHLPAPASLECYTFGSSYRDTQDVRIARKVAKICSQPHQVIEIGEEFVRKFPEYAARSSYLSEGSIDVYRAADLYVSEKARQIAPTKIVGTYGSEIVRQAVMFKPAAPLPGLFNPDFLTQVRKAGTTYSTLLQKNPVTFAAFIQSPWYHHGILALEQSQLTVRSPFMDNNFVKAVYRGPKESLTNGDVRLRLIKEGNAGLGRIRSDRGIGGNGGALSSLIARNYQEFTFKAEYAYDYGMPQGVVRLDHFVSPLHLERLFLGRHKHLHFRVWYRDQLADYVRQILLDPMTLSRPYLEKKTLETIVRDHIKGTRNYTTAIHKLLTLELLERHFLARN